MEPQCAFIISKKVEKKSVGRHEIKRKLAEVMAGFLPRLPKNGELVFLVKSAAAGASKEQVRQEVEGVLKRARLL